MMELADYQDRFKTAAVTRDDSGILTIRLHSRGGPMTWNALAHSELPELFKAVGTDAANRVVVLTGTGTHFIETPEGYGDVYRSGSIGPAVWERGIKEASALLFNALDIPVPVVAAVNGPVTAHSELVLMSDIVLCSDETYFQDIAHVPNGLVPGDGVQIIWPLVVGHSRSRYFLLTGEKIDAAAALALGVVGEVLPAAQLMDRAMFHANTLAAMSPTMLRHTRQVLVRPLREALTRDLNAGIGMEALASLTDAANANPN